MDELPGPPAPADLPALRADEVRTVTAGTLVWRIYHAGGPHPARWDTFRSWGPHPSARFDHHPPPAEEHDERAVLYAAIRAAPRHDDAQLRAGAPDLTCIAERFQDDRVIDTATNQPWLAALRLEHDLSLLDLASAWGTRAGCGSLLATGPRSTARDWSRAIYERYEDLDGLIWPSSVYSPGDALVLYERATSAMPSHPALNIPLGHHAYGARLENVADSLDYLLV